MLVILHGRVHYHSGYNSVVDVFETVWTSARPKGEARRSGRAASVRSLGCPDIDLRNWPGNRRRYIGHFATLLLISSHHGRQGEPRRHWIPELGSAFLQTTVTHNSYVGGRPRNLDSTNPLVRILQYLYLLHTPVPTTDWLTAVSNRQCVPGTAQAQAIEVHQWSSNHSNALHAICCFDWSWSSIHELYLNSYSLMHQT